MGLQKSLFQLARALKRERLGTKDFVRSRVMTVLASNGSLPEAHIQHWTMVHQARVLMQLDPVRGPRLEAAFSSQPAHAVTSEPSLQDCTDSQSMGGPFIKSRCKWPLEGDDGPYAILGL